MVIITAAESTKLIELKIRNKKKMLKEKNKLKEF